MGRVYYNWYHEHCSDDIKVTMKDWGLDFAQLAETQRELLFAMVTKQVTITEVYTDENGEIHQRDIKKLMDFTDNATRLRALELMSNILGATKEAAEEMPLLIIHRVGNRSSEIRFRRKLRKKKRKKDE